ncbi:MAG: Mrp/NBP35 family ATP-binding protein [Clostridia bacterium]|nr:Mrp/NBP35 family ATP-binding protein [Clostridia bacterium]
MEEQNTECTHDCSTCSAACSSRTDGKSAQQSFVEKQNRMSNVKRVIAVMSGKGGVGKSMVTDLLAVTMQRRGYKVAVFDADITGPSAPKAFGVKGRVEGSELGMFPKMTKTGIKLMSINLLLEEEDKPVVWRGPVIAGVVKQFWTDVVWDEVDYMFVDMPPGTGDVPLTVFQSLPIDGAVIVTTPQELVSMIVKKSANMAKLMNIDIAGVVENMSYVVCPDCGKHIDVFGKSNAEATAKELGFEVIGKLPMDAGLASLADRGVIELFENDYLDAATDLIENKYPVE